MHCTRRGACGASATALLFRGSRLVPLLLLFVFFFFLLLPFFYVFCATWWWFRMVRTQLAREQQGAQGIAQLAHEEQRVALLILAVRRCRTEEVTESAAREENSELLGANQLYAAVLAQRLTGMLAGK